MIKKHGEKGRKVLLRVFTHDGKSARKDSEITFF